MATNKGYEADETEPRSGEASSSANAANESTHLNDIDTYFSEEKIRIPEVEKVGFLSIKVCSKFFMCSLAGWLQLSQALGVYRARFPDVGRLLGSGKYRV